MASLQASWFSSFNSISHTNTKKSQTLIKPFRVNFSLISSNDESSETGSETQQASTDPVKLAFAKAREYKKSIQSSPKLKTEQNPVSGETKEVPNSVKIAMEKAKEYAKNKGSLKSDKISGLNTGNSGREAVEEKAEKKAEFSISNMDFVGLNFADKKTGRSIPAGLVPISDPFPEGDFPEVEIIVGDKTKFADGKSTKKTERAQEEENEQDIIYKPKVSTWGVFPRPSNISKTFGGGRNLKPGEALESTEEKAAKEAHTRELIAAYRKKTGIDIDPKLKYECQEALNDGDALMDDGKLSEALAYYQKVMDNMPFQSELHGLAALQWAICLDSLTRSKEAQVMYKKLQSHPISKVSKKARQFMYSFQAMEMMKVKASSQASSKNTDYQNFFEAFIEKKTNYQLNKVDENEIDIGLFSNSLPYILLLVSPIFLVLLAAVQKRT